MAKTERVLILVAGTLLAIHAAALVTWVTWRVFGPNPPVIRAGTASALAAVYGLPAVAYGVMQIRKARNDQRNY